MAKWLFNNISTLYFASLPTWHSAPFGKVGSECQLIGRLPPWQSEFLHDDMSLFSHFARCPAPLEAAISERFFGPSGMPKPLPLGEVSAKQTERASPSPGSRHAAMGRLFVRAILSLCQSCLAAALPSQSGLRPPAPPKGEPLAGRATSYWTPEARYGAKGRALLQRAAASGQRTLSSCRWPRQRSTTVPETSCFARPA